MAALGACMGRQIVLKPTLNARGQPRCLGFSALLVPVREQIMGSSFAEPAIRVRFSMLRTD